MATEEKSPQEKKNVLADMVALVMLLFFKLLAHWINLQGEWEYDDIQQKRERKTNVAKESSTSSSPAFLSILYVDRI